MKLVQNYSFSVKRAGISFVFVPFLASFAFGNMVNTR